MYGMKKRQNPLFQNPSEIETQITCLVETITALSTNKPVVKNLCLELVKLADAHTKTTFGIPNDAKSNSKE